MFERYTEKARRVIFFARYEASQYGSPYIETEHLLLGLLARGQGAREPLSAHARLDRIHPQGNRIAHHRARAHLDFGGSSSQPGMQAHPQLRRRRSRAAGPQARGNRTPAAGRVARREILWCRNPAGTGIAAFHCARGIGSQRGREGACEPAKRSFLARGIQPRS